MTAPDPVKRIVDYIEARAEAAPERGVVRDELLAILNVIDPERRRQPQPPVGAVVEVATGSGDQRIYYRRNQIGWLENDDPHLPHAKWENLAERAIRLVPDPAAHLVPLPWSFTDHTVERHPSAGDVLRINGTGLPANQIRILGAICAAMTRPGAERDALFTHAERTSR